MSHAESDAPEPAPNTDELLAIGWEERWAWWIVSAIVALGVVLRLHLIDMPLDRDEGEYAYGGQLLLQGILPYAGLYSMKLPGMYLINAVWLGLFGETVAAVHIGLLITHGATALLVFVLGRRIGNARIGLCAAASFSVFACTQALDGMSANSEHFVLLPLVAGLVTIFSPRGVLTSRRAFAAGLLLGLGVVIKQHGVVLALFGLTVLVHEVSRKESSMRGVSLRVIACTAGIGLPFLMICAWMAAAGNFSNFWFWTFSYAREYSSSAPLAAAWPSFVRHFARVFAPTPLLWLLSALGLLLVSRSKSLAHNRWFLPLFALFLLIAISPGFYYRTHYFVLVLPCAALLCAVAIDELCRMRMPRVLAGLAPWVGYLALLLALANGLAHEWPSLFSLPPETVSKRRFGPNPFTEAVHIGRYLRENSEADATIAILGSEPEIYFYARRNAVTPFIYAYPLMEQHPYATEMQRQMISDIEVGEPDYLVFVNVSLSWLQRDASSREIFEWYKPYVREHYVPDGLVEIQRSGSVMRWGGDAPWPPRSGAWVAVFKRVQSESKGG